MERGAAGACPCRAVGVPWCRHRARSSSIPLQGVGGGAHCAWASSSINSALSPPPKGKDALQEVEALMERMKLLQESQQEEEGVTQEEMATRFELEKTESLLVAPSGEEGREGSGGVPAGWGARGEGDGVPAVGAGCWGLTAVPCRPRRPLAAVQRPVLRGGPRVRLQGLHAAGRAGAPHFPCAGGCGVGVPAHPMGSWHPQRTGLGPSWSHLSC